MKDDGNNRPRERPAHRRSVVWDQAVRDAVMELVAEGYSFRQIAQHLTARGIPMSASGLQQWHRKYVGRRRSAKAETGSVPAVVPKPQSRPAVSGKSISDLQAEDKRQRDATLGKFFTKSKE